MTVTKNWWGWFDFGKSSEHEESLYQNGTKLYQNIKFDTKSQESNFLRPLVRTLLEEPSILVRPLHSNTTQKWNAKISGGRVPFLKGGMSQWEIQPTLIYCFDVKRNCPSRTCLSKTTDCFKQPSILPSCFGTLASSFIHLFIFHRSYRCGICHLI